MAEIRSCADWQHVGTLEDLQEYLLVLPAEANETDRWKNTTIPTFLAAWAAYLSGNGGGVEIPGWRGLAFFLFEARNSDPHTSGNSGRFSISPENVDSGSDLVSYLMWLCRDFALDQEETAERARRGLWAHEGRWAHSDLGAWFEAWAAWLAEQRVRSRIEPVTWRSCALQLAASRVYE